MSWFFWCLVFLLIVLTHSLTPNMLTFAATLAGYFWVFGVTRSKYLHHNRDEGGMAVTADDNFDTGKNWPDPTRL